MSSDDKVELARSLVMEIVDELQRLSERVSETLRDGIDVRPVLNENVDLQPEFEADGRMMRHYYVRNRVAAKAGTHRDEYGRAMMQVGLQPSTRPRHTYVVVPVEGAAVPGAWVEMTTPADIGWNTAIYKPSQGMHSWYDCGCPSNYTASDGRVYKLDNSGRPIDGLGVVDLGPNE